MSIPLVQEATKDAINTSIIAIKRNIERINMLLGLSNSEEIDTSVFATKDELQQAITDLQPVDEVALNNMHSVTSNAVAGALKGMKVIEEGSVSSGNGYYIKFDNGLIFVTDIFSMGRDTLAESYRLYAYHFPVNLPVALKTNTKPLFFNAQLNSIYGTTPNVWFIPSNDYTTTNTVFGLQAISYYPYTFNGETVNFTYIGWWK